MGARTTPAPLVALTVAAAAAVALRRTLLRWGASPEEVAASLPGDEILPDAGVVATRASDVAAPPEEVWPWLAQLGQGRGGFYTYDALENLAGCDIHSAETVVAAWQDVAVGDQVRLAPELGLDVADVRAGEHLVLHGGVAPGTASPPYDFTWAFVLRPDGDGGTRLVVRERYRTAHHWVRPLLEAVSLVSFVMTERMLRGIRERAERGTVRP
ncbi:SRPBCC family protein [Georgenia daeguensis]|uniref:SRPBCC family protein n=1 Tax=Georgenia daeguensis TaxID=908355 RepID=A0ABP8ETM4_9MICO